MWYILVYIFHIHLFLTTLLPKKSQLVNFYVYIAFFAIPNVFINKYSYSYLIYLIAKFGTIWYKFVKNWKLWQSFNTYYFGRGVVAQAYYFSGCGFNFTQEINISGMEYWIFSFPPSGNKSKRVFVSRIRRKVGNGWILTLGSQVPSVKTNIIYLK